MNRDNHKRSWWSEITALLCKPVDNRFSITKYESGQLLLVGDTVQVSRRLLPPITGTIVELDKHRHLDNFTVDAAYVVIKNKRYRICPRRITVQQRETSFLRYRAPLDLEATDLFLSGKYDLVPGIIDAHFSDAVFLSATDPSSDQIRPLLEAVLAKADNLIENRHLLNPNFLSSDLVMLLQCRAYASALLGDGLRREDLQQAVAIVEQISNATDPPYWTGDYQDRYLSAARMCIIAGDMDRARKLLQSKRSFSKHKDQRRLLKKLTRKSTLPSKDAELKSQCLAYLAFVSHPRASDAAFFYAAFWGRLEWSAIIGKLLLDPENEIDWHAVVARMFRQKEEALQRSLEKIC